MKYLPDVVGGMLAGIAIRVVCEFTGADIVTVMAAFWFGALYWLLRTLARDIAGVRS